MAMHDLTGFQRDLLFVVASLGDPHGLAVKDELQKDYEDNIRHGRLYPNLDELVELGLINKGEKNSRTNQYTISPRGKRELRARLEWELEHCPPDVLAASTSRPTGRTTTSCFSTAAATLGHSRYPRSDSRASTAASVDSPSAAASYTG